jgi:chromosome segregation ATPase
MSEDIPARSIGIIPEAASATSVVLLTLATIASGVGAVIWWHAPLAMCTLVVGAYVLHLIALRRAARDAVVSHAADAKRLAMLREEEFEQQLREVDRMQPELEKERARMEEQWQHLKGLVDERESRKRTLKEYEANLEAVREEAATALAAARLEVRARETSETELRDRITELEADRARAAKALRAVLKKQARLKAERQAEKQAQTQAGKQARTAAEQEARAVVAGAEEKARNLVAEAEAKLESARLEEREREQTRQVLAGQIEDLETARAEAEDALRDVAAHRAELQAAQSQPSAYVAAAEAGAIGRNGGTTTDFTKPHTIDPPRLRAWQFIAHKRELARSPED